MLASGVEVVRLVVGKKRSAVRRRGGMFGWHQDSIQTQICLEKEQDVNLVYCDIHRHIMGSPSLFTE